MKESKMAGFPEKLIDFPSVKKIKREFEGISSDPSSSFLLFTV